MINDDADRVLTVVLDIDNVLAEHASITEDEKLYYLRKSGIMLAAEREHQVLVGAVELIKYLMTKPTINIAFFS